MNRKGLALLFALLIGTCAHARDVDGDGVVDGRDLQIMRDAFYGYDVRADLDGDGRVNFADLALLRAERDGHGSPVTPAALPTMTLLPAVQDVPLRNEFVLELWMDFTAEPTIGGGTDIYFDAGALDYVTFEFDAGLGDDPAFRRIPDLEAPGVLNALAFGNFNGLTGPALVGRFTFEARTTPGVTALTMAADQPDGVAGPFVSAITFLPMAVSFIGAEINVLDRPISVIVVDPPLANFDMVRVGHHEPRLLTVSNTGDAALPIRDVGALDPAEAPFEIVRDTCSRRTLAPAGQCSIVVSMAPETAQVFQDHFSIVSGDPVAPVVIVGLFGKASQPLGIHAVAANEPGQARCENFATGQVVTGDTNVNGAFNCEANGLDAPPNAPVSVSFSGQQFAAVGNGLTIEFVRCENLTSGQTVDFPLPPDVRTWNCIAEGLVVAPGDRILMTAAGVAD